MAGLPGIEDPLKTSKYFSIVGSIGLIGLLVSKTLITHVFLSLSALLLTISSILSNGAKWEKYQVYVLFLSILFALLAILFHFISRWIDLANALIPYLLVTYLVGVTILYYLDKNAQT